MQLKWILLLNFRHATVNFADEKDAASALEASKGAVICGKAVTVLYSMGLENAKKKSMS